MKLRRSLPLLACVSTLGACSVAAAAPGHGSPSGTRVWHAYVAAPAQFDLSLAEISFGAPAHVASAGASRSTDKSSIRLALRGTSGLDYVAGAVTHFNVRGRPRALVLVVNRRPRGSLAPDVARIGLAVTAARRLGVPVLRQISNPFTRHVGLTPSLCDLPIRGASLTAGDLRAVLSRGLPLMGPQAGDHQAVFGAEAAVAQAYDAVCGRPYAPAFRQAVTQGSGPSCEPAQASGICCPPNAMCLPPPCPPCPCATALCPAPVSPAPKLAIACPPASPPIACPL
jgi:hypothetical protein